MYNALIPLNMYYEYRIMNPYDMCIINLFFVYGICLKNSFLYETCMYNVTNIIKLYPTVVVL